MNRIKYVNCAVVLVRTAQLVVVPHVSLGMSSMAQLVSSTVVKDSTYPKEHASTAQITVKPVQTLPNIVLPALVNKSLTQTGYAGYHVQVDQLEWVPSVKHVLLIVVNVPDKQHSVLPVQTPA